MKETLDDSEWRGREGRAVRKRVSPHSSRGKGGRERGKNEKTANNREKKWGGEKSGGKERGRVG